MVIVRQRTITTINLLGNPKDDCDPSWIGFDKVLGSFYHRHSLSGERGVESHVYYKEYLNEIGKLNLVKIFKLDLFSQTKRKKILSAQVE